VYLQADRDYNKDLAEMYGNVTFRSPNTKYLAISSYLKDVRDKFD